MPTNARAKVRVDPLAPRLAALVALMDQVLASLRARAERLRDLRAALALAREGDADARKSDQLTGVRHRDLRE